MHEDPVRNINPNTLHGCHPIDLPSKFENHPFHLIVKQSEAPLPKVSSRLRLLEKILNDISRCDLPAKDHFADYMHQRYRRNCKPNTLPSASTGLKQFLSFLLMSGKQHIEQLTREDIKAFTESLQDRGLKPTTECPVGFVLFTRLGAPCRAHSKKADQGFILVGFSASSTDSI